MSEKPELRRQIRTSLLEQSQGRLREASKGIRDRVQALPLWEGARVIGLFAAQPLEPYVDPLLEVAIALGKRVVYPRITPHGLALVEVASEVDLRETPRWKLREPSGEHLMELDPSEVDLLLVPGLAFDRAGFRLGRGGGYYDRLLGEVKQTARCGICFALQLVPAVPVEKHDQAVSLVVTEEDALRCAPRL